MENFCEKNKMVIDNFCKLNNKNFKFLILESNLINFNKNNDYKHTQYALNLYDRDFDRYEILFNEEADTGKVLGFQVLLSPQTKDVSPSHENALFAIIEGIKISMLDKNANLVNK